MMSGSNYGIIKKKTIGSKSQGDGQTHRKQKVGTFRRRLFETVRGSCLVGLSLRKKVSWACSMSLS